MSASNVTSGTSQNRSDGLISSARSRLLIVDIQEKLLPVIDNNQAVLANVLYLVRCAATLGVPVSVSEQYPRGLGSTVPKLKAELSTASSFEKLRFSAAEGYQQLEDHEMSLRPQVVVAGIETHICVLQTCLDLMEANFSVFVIADATGSRSEADHSLALQRLAQAGVSVVTVESVAFEWCEAAGSDAFRTVSRLTRERCG